MIRRLIFLPIASLIIGTACSGAASAQNSLDPLVMPQAPMPNPEQVIEPPKQTEYFPMRQDGQPYMSNIDMTSNLTDWLNHYYFDPKWRGEQWTPYPMYWQIERECRMMMLWPDYDEQNMFAKGNRWCKFLEKWSGYGPGPPGGFVTK